MGEERHSFFAAVMGELSRRKVLKTIGGYAVGVFVVLQVMDAVVELMPLPGWVPTAIVAALILGFPIVFLLAWRFDITGHGVEQTSDESLLAPAQTFALFSIMLFATGGLGYGFYQYYMTLDTGDTPAATTFIENDARSFTAPENSIAVLPFTDLSENRDQGHLSDGMAEEILNLLAQVDGLHVAARTSSFAFREPEEDIRQIGRALNVSTVLEGSLRTSGNRIRLTAQLINVEDGYHIWSQNFDRELTDVFALQDEVASMIAAALVESFDGLVEEAPTTRPQNIEAYGAYKEGRELWWRRTPADLELAIQRFGEALDHDPLYAPAYAALADSFVLLALYGDLNPMRAVDRAMPMIEKALALDPESAEALAALGLARMEIGQQDSAESALRKAIKLDDVYVPARLWLSNLLGATGRLEEQTVILQEAMVIDPLNELLAINYADNLSSQGEVEAARELINDLLLIKRDSLQLLRSASLLDLHAGELVRGWQLARQAYDLSPETPSAVYGLSKAWLELGDLERSEALLLEGLALAEENNELNNQYFQLLLLDGRLEEAESRVRDAFGDDLDALPDNFRRYYHHQMGLIHLVGENLPMALVEFEQAIRLSPSKVFDGDQLFALTTAAFLHGAIGDASLAEQRLTEAVAALQRARDVGIDTPDVYYTQSIIDILRNDFETAVASLQAAYDRGWRQLWLIDLDGRLDPLRSLPAFIELKSNIEGELQAARTEIEGRMLSQLSGVRQ
ncbi:MAG: hypothetical protein AAGH19_01905 [Pseudomonadota bacterium]